MHQDYMLTIRELFLLNNGVVCGAETQVAILDEGIEVDRVVFSGKCERYQRRYSGKPGLKAKIASGPGRITMDAILLV
ncbi:MAG: hypothetical protein RR736_23975 [Pseudomonas sp.]|uniref:hypothetical protein n=1 Tax=Pseudomonas sp. TaxID=306 RepID=UPI002FC91391